MAIRDESQEIGELAIDIINRKRPSNYLSHEPSKDYGIDLRFEVFHESERTTTGVEFGVQSKGTRSIKYVDGGKYVTYPKFETSNLIDHVDARRFPVFLFRVDVTNDQIYWVCLQQFAIEVLDKKKKNWRNQKSLTIRLPVENTFPSSEFATRLNEAVEFVNNLHPSSVESAVSKVKRNVAMIDDRFEVEILTRGDGVAKLLNPKEHIDLKLNLTGKTAVDSMRKFMEEGNSVTFSTGQFGIEGSPLFENANAQGRLEIRSVPSDKLQVQVNFLDRHSKTLSTALLPGAKSIGGSRTVNIETSTKHPIKFSAELRRDADGVELNGQLNISFDRWNGKRLLSLPYFNVLNSVFETCENVSSVEIVLLGEGMPLTSNLMTPPEGFHDLHEFQSLVAKAVEFGNHFKKDPVFTSDCNWDDIVDLHWLTFDMSERCQNRPFVQNNSTYPVVKNSFADSHGGWPIRNSIRQFYPSLTFEFFGTTIQSLPHTIEFNPVEMYPVEGVDNKEAGIASDEVLLGIRFLSETKARAFAGNPIDEARTDGT